MRGIVNARRSRKEQAPLVPGLARKRYLLYHQFPMASRLRRSFQSPLFLLALVAGLLSFCVQSGELGTADTMHRLQTAHSFWTAEPAVFPNEYPEFGVHGRGGKLYDWYGLGQPLLLLPVDVVGTYLEKLPIFDDYAGTDPTVRNIFVTYTINTLINVLTALVCFRLLEHLGFDLAQSVAGVLALLFCTTHLHYTQNMMENNYILLLTLTGLAFQYEWLRTGNGRALLIGSAALGMNLIIRLTTGLDLITAGIFLLLILWFERAGKQEFWRRFVIYAKIALPTYLFFLLVDRVYQFYRFGSWTDTYVHYFSREHRLLNPSLSPRYPWETPFHVGFLGPLITPEKSIFLFDPLLVLTILIVALKWRRFNGQVKAYVVASGFLVVAYICFYARYTVWSGDFAWGDRYVSTAVELLAFIAVPLLLKFKEELGRFVWAAGLFLVTASLLIQLASLAFWLSLEIYQAEDLGHPQLVIWLRFKNIIAFALGKMDAWGLNTDAMTYDPWDYQHVTTWNFLPFVLKRIGQAPRWVVNMTLAFWYAEIAALLAGLLKLKQALSGSVTTGQSHSAA